MRHNRQTHRFGRNPKERKAMLENMVSSLIYHQQITTTLQKAKQAQRLADRVITLGKNDTLNSRRQVFSYLQDHALTFKLFKEVAPRFKSRKGGYTRILQLDRRRGDGAQLALLELTEKEIKLKETKSKAKKESATKTSADRHKHDHEHESAKPDAPGKVKTKPSEQPRKKGGFFGNISKFFRNKGGS